MLRLVQAFLGVMLLFGGAVALRAGPATPEVTAALQPDPTEEVAAADAGEARPRPSPRVIEGTPVGSSTPSEVVVFAMDYTTTANTPIDDITSFSLWIDSQLPSGIRLHSSLHGKLERLTSNPATFELKGEALTGTADCANPKHLTYCWKNYTWSVSPANDPTVLVSSGTVSNPPSGALYMNHAFTRQDTPEPTDSTIGRVRVLWMKRTSDHSMQIGWELRFDPYFLHRELNVYQAMSTASGAVYRQPSWRNAGIWAVGEPVPQTLLAEDHLDRVPLVGLSGGASQVRTGTVYLGAGALAVQGSRAEKDFGQLRAGIYKARFYDDLSSASVGVGLSATPSPSAPPVWIGVYNNSPRYMVRSRIEDGAGNELPLDPAAPLLLDSGVARSAGWKEVTFYVTDVGAWAEIRDSLLGLDSVSMSQLAPASGPARVIPIRIDLSAVRYMQLGPLFASQSLPAAGLFFDELSVTSLPAVPDLATATTPEGGLAWDDRWAAIYLDHYEEVLTANNMDWVAQSADKKQSGAFNSTMHSLSLALSIRYRSTGLELYRTEMNRLLLATMNPNAGTHVLASLRLLDPAVKEKVVERTLDAADRAMQNEPITARPDGSFYQAYAEPQLGIGNAVIGDSHAENYAAFGPQVNALAAALLTQEQSYYDLALKLARKGLSTDVNERYHKWPERSLGVKNVYGPQDRFPECPELLDPERRQDCLCRGDRAEGRIPADHDFAFLIDNHDYSPHPMYMQAALLGPLSSIVVLKSAGVPVEEDYYADFKLARMIGLVYGYVDYRRQLFENTDKIVRVRGKDGCEEASTPADPDRYVNPYAASDNSFRSEGRDDWGSLPDINPGFFAMVEYAFRDRDDCWEMGMAYGCHFDGPLDLYTQTSKLYRWAHHNMIGQSEEPNVVFLSTDFTEEDHHAARLVTSSIRNALSRALNRIGFYDIPPQGTRTIGDLVSGGAQTSASAHPERAAALVDGKLDTMWNAELGPTQHVILDLGQERRVQLIKLYVEQTPTGTSTTHKVYLSTTAGSFPAAPARTLTGKTWDGQALNLFFADPVPARYVKVETTDSQSSVAWNEVEVYEAPR